LLTSVGGKNAALGEVKNRLKLLVPMGFAVTTTAYERFIHANQLDQAIRQGFANRNSGEANLKKSDPPHAEARA